MATEFPDGDRLVLRLDANAPVEVSNLTESFAALARMYERHYRSGGEPAPKLFITKLETGSIVAEVAPYVMIMGALVTTMDTAVIVADFSSRLIDGVKAFARVATPQAVARPLPSRDDAFDLQKFLKPLAGRKGSSLCVRHAKIRVSDGAREIAAEYVFDEAEINRASINMEGAIDAPALPEVIVEHETSGIVSEVTLVFDQASRKPGKESGKTGDRGLIAELHPKPLPVYFRKAADDLKDQMVRGDVNPLTNNAFVVDVHVFRVDGAPKAFIVTNLHAILPLSD